MLAKPECFAVRRGEVSRTRCDVDAYHPEHLSLVNLISRLSDTATISEIVANPLVNGFAAGKERRARPGEVSAPQIRPTQILPDGEIDLTDAYGIGVDSIAERNYLQVGEVLFNNTNSTALVGKSAVFNGLVPAVCSNHITRLRLREGIEPEFVVAVLNMLRETGYFARLCTNFNNQAGVNMETLGSVRIPLPPADQRERLVAAMDAAQAERRDKLAEADRLLAGVNGFVLDTLGIAPVEDTRRVFAVRLGQMRDSRRLNPNYYHPQRTQTLRLLEPSPNLDIAPLSGLVDFVRDQIPTPGENYLSMSHVRSHTGEFVDAGNTAVGNCYLFQSDDVLFSRMAPNLNKVYRAEWGGCCSTEFHVLRVKDLAAVLPEYLAAFLRSSLMLAQTVHMATGSTRPRLSNDEVVNLRIPIPDRGTQETIANEVIRRREEARQLRAAAESGWVAAKEQFEKEVLSVI